MLCYRVAVALRCVALRCAGPRCLATSRTSRDVSVVTPTSRPCRVSVQFLSFPFRFVLYVTCRLASTHSTL